MATNNLLIRWLEACSGHQRRRLAQRMSMMKRGPQHPGGLDVLAAGLLAECAADLEMEPGRLASLVGNPRVVAREAVLLLALAGLGDPISR